MKHTHHNHPNHEPEEEQEWIAPPLMCLGLFITLVGALFSWWLGFSGLTTILLLAAGGILVAAFLYGIMLAFRMAEDEYHTGSEGGAR